ncbi:MAG: ribose 5-phosphate isomerase B [Salinivirgaceae bacterium]|nr:ribose 5-phosphate isomerase B [Salinivirgaceae bacterium]MDD4747316.1 ribose 5-phosphate isomerase B [Salinivirgaceae bacterium]MDY0279346.1 ribose 5-phosphate isomerase B [Salinivirgaceae bacterium]
MNKDKIYLASDHGGYLIKRHIASFLLKEGYDVIDLGPDSEDSVDYPDYAHKLAQTIGENGRGVAICGSGIGISIALNRHLNVRAALCHNVDMAVLSRLHNNANVCVLPGRFVSLMQSEAIVHAFLNGIFEGGRHNQRIDKINQIE